VSTSSKRRLQIRTGLILGAAIVAYLCYAGVPEKFDALDARIIDRLFVLRSKAKPVQPLTTDGVVHIDANLYFSRSQHARILRNLSAMGAAAQVIDFNFVEKVSREEDQPLIRATREAGNVYFGMNFEALDAQPGERPAPADVPSGEKTSAANWPVVADDAGNLLRGRGLQLTYPGLASAAQGLGFLNLTADADGILRRLPLVVRYDDSYVPSLSLRVVAGYLGVSAANIIVEPGKSVRLKGARRVSQFSGGDVAIPVDRHGRLILGSTDLVDGLKHYSYSEIFQASETRTGIEKLASELTGKIAVISETVEKNYQARTTSEAEMSSSGVIQALALQTLLSGSYLRELPGSVLAAIEIILLAGVFLLSLRFASVTLSLATVALAGLYITLAVVSFVYAGTLFQFARPLLLLLCALAFLLIGLGIEKAVLAARSERARKIAERDLEIGREIQAGFFPAMLPETDGWELATHFQAARHVAGDFYDIFTLGKDGKIAVVIADVCDKGVGAALFMALFRSFIRVLSGSADGNDHLDIADGDGKPEKILRRVIGSINNYISITHEQAGMFATIFYGILDPRRAELTYINGGHEPPIVRGPQGIKTHLGPTGPAVGLYPDLDFKVRTVTLEPDDMLLAYTDGVTDARSKAGDVFSKEQLLEVAANSSRTAAEMIAGIRSRLDEHIFGAAQFDDITIVALRRKQN